MSAVVCGKRSSSIFEEHLHSTSPPASKRIRCFSGGSSPPTAAHRSSPPRTYLSPSSLPSSDQYSSSSCSAALAHLQALFPDMDPQLLERVLETSGNDLDSAIRILNDLRLESNSGIAVIKSDTGVEADVQLLKGVMQNTTGVADLGGLGHSSTADILPADGSEWVDLFVREMMNASDMDDAKARASRVLEVLEKTIVANGGAEAVETLNKENVVLKEQVGVLIRENTILKRAVAIQHERQKEYDERGQELQHLKQLVIQYQEQLRTLEVNNYALMMHLRQAEQNNSIPGRFHPDIF